MLIYFIATYIGYWAQSDWGGGGGQIDWQDSCSYMESNYLDNKRISGSLSMFAPSGKWKASVPLSINRVNAVAYGEKGVLYVGCGWDSGYVFKLGNFGDTILAMDVLVKDGRVGEVTALFRHPDGRVFAGLQTGDVFVLDEKGAQKDIDNYGKTKGWTHVLNLGASIRAIYRPSFPWIYISAGNGIIMISKIDGINWKQDTVRVVIPNTKVVNSIFEGSRGLKQTLYVCTRSTGDVGEVFKSIDDGISWTKLYSFPNSQSAYSITEDKAHNLYVSTGISGRIFTSSNGGSTWSSVSTPWGSADFYNIIADSCNILYVGGECRGAKKAPKGIVFRSQDRGVSWDTFFISDGNKPTTTLSLIQSREGFMAIGGDTDLVFISGYSDSGWIVSSIYDAFEPIQLVNKSLEFWKVYYESAGSNGLRVRFRSSWDKDSSGAWSLPIPNNANPVNYGGVQDGDRYLQYRIEFLSDSNGFWAPTLSDICIKYFIDAEGPEVYTCSLYKAEQGDYVILNFNEPTNCPRIETNNIDSILKLSNGHSWRSDSGRGVIRKPGEWITPYSFKISLSTLKIGVGEGYPSTLSVGDIITPDSITIMDRWENRAFKPCTLRLAVGIEESGEHQVSEIKVEPNPLRKNAELKYFVAEDGEVRLSMYDISGRLIEKLIDNTLKRGTYSINISSMQRGIYFIRYEAGNSVISKKLVCF